MALPAVPALREIGRHPAFLAMAQHPMFAALSRDQRHRLLHAGRVEQLVAGQVFAEAVAFMARPVYQMTATAATAARVLGIPNQGYVEILLGNRRACREVLQHLSSRLHLRIREIEGITLESATSRVARLLESRMPPDATSSARIRLTQTRQELASYLAMKPETLSRALRVLADDGAVAVHGRNIDVVSRARLRSHFDDAENPRSDS